jgi:hypothetical protein
MMIEQQIRQLRHPDPQLRRAAILALADSLDPRAASYLAQVAKNDPVTSLRVLAERAQRHAQRNVWRAIPAEEHVTPKTDPWYRHVERANAEINDNQRRARLQLHNAHGSNANGDVKGALNYLINAFELDPDLMRSKEAMRLTAELTGEPVETAVDKLMARIKKKEKAEGPTPFGTLIAYILVESAALFLILTGIMYLILSSFSRFATMTPKASSALSSSLARLGGANPLLACATAAGILLAGYMIYFLIMYGVASMMGGAGTIFDFINVMLRVYIVMMAVTLIALGLAAVIKPSRAVFSTISLSVGVVNFIAVAYFAAREMEFGFLRGVATVFAPQILVCMAFALLLVLDFGKAAVQFFSSLPG